MALRADVGDSGDISWSEDVYYHGCLVPPEYGLASPALMSSSATLVLPT